MTQEEAIKIVRENMHLSYDKGNIFEALETLIPELRESEDEKFRKYILQVCKDFVEAYNKGLELSMSTTKKLLAYLEKQKELFKDGTGLYYYNGEKTTYCGYPATKDNPYDFAMSQQKERGPLTKDEEYTLHRIIEYLEDETCPSEWISLLHDIYCLPYTKQKEQKPVTIVRIPKFRVGDIIQHVPLEKWDRSKKITSINEHGYNFNLSHLGDTVSGGSIGFTFEDEYELVEQKPAEPSGEGISREDILNNIYQNGLITLSDFLYLTEKKEQKPVEEQFPPLKGLDAIKAEYYDKGFKNGFDEGVDSVKPVEWSEEDRSILEALIYDIERLPVKGVLMHHPRYYYIKFLKSICPQPKQEWSEEDINDVIERLKLAYKETKNEMFLADIMRLKSLRPKSKDELKGKGLDAEIKKYTENLYHETFGNGQGTLDEFDWEDISTVIEDTARHFYSLRPSWKPSDK